VAEMKTDLVEMTKLWKVSEKLEAFIDSSKEMHYKGLDLDFPKDMPRRS
jgi:hypothetical protein